MINFYIQKIFMNLIKMQNNSEIHNKLENKVIKDINNKNEFNDNLYINKFYSEFAINGNLNNSKNPFLQKNNNKTDKIYDKENPFNKELIDLETLNQLKKT